MNIDVIDVWRHLHLNNVKYLTIGGFAVNFYGYQRTTGDIDLLIEDSAENRKKLRQTFIEIGLGDFEELERVEFIPGWTDFALGYGITLDIMTAIKGFDKDAFADLYQKSKTTFIQDVPVKFIDYAHLIIAKQATNRPKDQLDIDELEKIRKMTGEI